MTTTVMALLVIDGAPRMCCVGCTMKLAELGMVRAIGERVVNERQPDYVATTYEIVSPYTLENCRGMIRHRHVGPAWGSGVT